MIRVRDELGLVLTYLAPGQTRSVTEDVLWDWSPDVAGGLRKEFDEMKSKV